MALGGTLPLQLGVNGAWRCLVVAERPSGLSACAAKVHARQQWRSERAAAAQRGHARARSSACARREGRENRERERGERKRIEREKERGQPGLTQNNSNFCIETPKSLNTKVV